MPVPRLLETIAFEIPNGSAAQRVKASTNYLAVNGACLMIAKRKYEEVGELDESLAVSYNDGDDTLAKAARAIEEVATIRKRWPARAARDPYYNPNLTVDAEDFELRL